MDNGAVFLRALSKMKEAGRVTIFGHVNPDGDAVGACFAAALAFAGEGVAPTVVLEPYSANFSYLSGAEYLHKGNLDSISGIVVCLDCAARGRLGRYEAFLDTAELVINIDHHEQGGIPPFGHINIIDTKASAACEILYELFTGAGITVTEEIAAALYTGICTDTGGFRHTCTTPRTHTIAAKLHETGIDFNKIQRKALYEQSLTQAAVLAMSIDSMKILPEIKLALSGISREQMKSKNASGIDFEGVVEYMLDISGIEVSALLTEREEGFVNVSLRSSSLNVRDIAARLGGGGHIYAAGAKSAGTLAEVSEAVIELVRKSYAA